MINLYKLRSVERHRTNIKKLTYRRLLNRCHRHIKFYAKKAHTECIFEVPEYVAGLPLYNHRKAYDYIFNKLIKNKLKAIQLSNSFIYISWNHIPLNIKKDKYRNKEEEEEQLYRDINDYKPIRNFIYDRNDYNLKKNKLLNS